MNSKIINIFLIHFFSDMPGNMVFTSAGDNTDFIKWWIDSNGSSDYDVYVYYYGKSEENYNKYKENVCYIEKSKGTKFQNFYKFWNKFPKIIEDYDRFFILDDDIEFTVSDINEMFRISREYDLLICQPSFTDRSKTSYEINKYKNSRILTYTNFIEVNTPLFHKEAIEKLMNVFDPSLEEWGVDYLYILVNGLKKESSYAVIHKIQCTNPLITIDINSKNREINLLHSEQYRMSMWRNYMSKNNISKFSISPIEYVSIYNEINILVVVVSCNKNKDLWPIILERGIENLVILCGGCESDSYLDSNILHLKCDDLYEGLPEKMICAIDFILKCPKFNSVTHILKVDDHDTIFTKDIIDTIGLKYKDILNTKEYIGQRLWKEGNYKHHYGKVTNHSYWHNRPFVGPMCEFADGGQTYILNRYAMKCINDTYSINNLAYLRNTYILEDVMIGIILKSYNIRPYQLNYGIKKIPNNVLLNTPVKILVVVVSCNKYKHLWPIILERGIENLIILSGGYHLDSYLDSNILHLKCDDLYEGLPEKMICAIDFILKCPKFNSVTHILKVDDHDTGFNKNTIESITNNHLNILNSNHYIGQRIKTHCIDPNYHMNNTSSSSIWKTNSYVGIVSPYCDGGRSYILSRHAMKCINNTFHINNLKYVRNNHIYEDIMIGLILNSYTISPFEFQYGVSKVSTIQDPKRIASHPISFHGDGKWIYIGSERERLTLPINSHIRFGHEDRWIEKITYVESFKADRWFFGGDPAHGIQKNVEYNLLSKLEKDSWIRIGYENTNIHIPLKSLLSFGNDQEGWIEKTVEESSFIASKEFFETTKQYHHKIIVRIFIKS